DSDVRVCGHWFSRGPGWRRLDALARARCNSMSGARTMASKTHECQTYEYRETIRGGASRSRLRPLYHEAGSQAAHTVGAAHTPYGTVEVSAYIWRDGGQT